MTTPAPYRGGDRVLVTAHGARARASVMLASPNGRSLILSFPGGLFGIAGGAYVGSMPVFLDDDGTWRELINWREISIERAD